MRNSSSFPSSKIQNQSAVVASLCRRTPNSAFRNPQSGYTLVALLAVMTLLMLFALVAAPSAKQQAQREREKEAIFRGEEVANAIRIYFVNHGSQGAASLPTSMDQLLEGIPKGTQKVQILRPEAAHDPLTASGEWRLIGPTSPELVQFAQAVTLYAGTTPPTRGPMAQFSMIIVNALNTGSSGATSDSGAVSSDTIGPFIGVASRSQLNSVITYYGIDRHDQWIFTPLYR